MAKNAKKAAKKEAARAGRTLAGRTLANPKARKRDKELAANVLSQTAKKKQSRK